MNIPNAAALLRTEKECAVKAGVYPYWFLAFGTLLGAARPTLRKYADPPYKADPHYALGLMAHDDDMDIGVFADNITAEQEEAYIAYLKEEKCFRWRRKFQRRFDNNRLLWFSMRREKPPDGTKMCHWFFYEWNDIMWHSKGSKWINELKFPSRKFPHKADDQAIGLGVPAKALTKEVVEIEFEGEAYNVPATTGKVLDYWYPKWFTPAGGSSRKTYVMCAPDWANQKTWRIF